MQQIKTLTLLDFEEALGEKLPDFLMEKIQNYDFKYTELDEAENTQLLIMIIDSLLDPNLIKSGKHRIDDWEKGWAENLNEVRNKPFNQDLILPNYFNKYGVVRFGSKKNGVKFIRPVSERFEAKSLFVILDWLFGKFIRDVSSIYEFGCGTGHNLLHAREYNKNAKLFGLDWAVSSQNIIKKLADQNVDSNIYGMNFDYFNPNHLLNIDKNSAIFTVASLEQVGGEWTKFIEYLIDKKPKICIHVEPIAEILDPNSLLDFLSIEYFKKRNYLNGFLDGLRSLEKKIKLRFIGLNGHILEVFSSKGIQLLFGPHYLKIKRKEILFI